MAVNLGMAFVRDSRIDPKTTKWVGFALPLDERIWNHI